MKHQGAESKGLRFNSWWGLCFSFFLFAPLCNKMKKTSLFNKRNVCQLRQIYGERIHEICTDVRYKWLNLCCYCDADMTVNLVTFRKPWFQHKWCNKEKLPVKPLNTSIGMCVLLIFLFPFPMVLTRRICLIIKSVMSFGSFPLFSWLNV